MVHGHALAGADALAATTVGNYALFGGGWIGSSSDRCDISMPARPVVHGLALRRAMTWPQRGRQLRPLCGGLAGTVQQPWTSSIPARACGPRPRSRRHVLAWPRPRRELRPLRRREATADRSSNVDIFNASTGQWSTATLSQARLTWPRRRSGTTPSSAAGVDVSTATATRLTSSMPARASGPRPRSRRRAPGRDLGRATTPSSAADG